MGEIKGGKLQLSEVTLIAMASVYVPETLEAMKYSMKDVDFGDAVFVTDRRPLFLPKGIRYGHIDRIRDIDDFNYDATYRLGSFVNTKFALLVHYDGYVVNPESWSDEFLNYDYIGSPWPLPKPGDDISYRDPNGNICRVGNSVSIRSKRLMDFPGKANIPWTGFEQNGQTFYNEDIFICCKIKPELEAAGMKIAPIETAVHFAQERMLPEGEGVKPFAFHKWDGTNSEYPDFRKEPLNKARNNISDFCARAERGIKRRLESQT